MPLGRSEPFASLEGAEITYRGQVYPQVSFAPQTEPVIQGTE